MTKDKDKDNKYGDVSQITNFADESAEKSPVSTRKNRRSPALGIVGGEKGRQKTSGVAKLASKVEELEESLKVEQQRNADLQLSLAEAQNQVGEGESFTSVMPVTNTVVTFKHVVVDPALIDVSPENERIQSLLDEISLQDILPGIKSKGQTKPGTIRPHPTKEGRYELIDGSRRLASVKLADISEYKAFLGDVPDADVAELSLTDNTYKDVSPYEKAVHYAALIANGVYSSWPQLAAAKGIGRTTAYRYKDLSEVDEVIVKAFTCPTDLYLRFVDTLKDLLEINAEAVYERAKSLHDQRSIYDPDNEEDFLTTEYVVAELKRSVKVKKQASDSADTGPKLYESSDKKVKIKHSVTKTGHTKFELQGVPEDKLNKVLKFLGSTLKVDIPQD